MSERRTAPDDAFFWNAAAEDRLVIQRCADCRTLRHPPAPMCGTCGSLAWDTLEASGRGRITSWMFSLHPNRPDDAPRVVILVQLDEGVRLVSNLVDAPHRGPYDDLRVVVEFRDDRGARTPFFRVDDGRAS
jgi:3-oxo-4,17-pregnadiene-20-carboxyl-CoA hydratase alpha subunit